MATSIFSSVETFQNPMPQKMYNRFLLDTSSDKVDLVYGVYQTDEGKSWVLPIVRRLERQMAIEMKFDKDYLPPLGLPSFTMASTRLLLGPESFSLKEGRVTSIQTISGGGALRLGAETLSKLGRCKTIYVSNPHWDAYTNMLLLGGFESYQYHRYWCNERKSLDLEGMLEDLRNAPENTPVLLQACGHNPSGVDPTQEQWREIADVMEERKLVPFFDVAYQGLASGDLENDAWPVRYFDSRGFEMLCAQSYSKNFGLYGERVGNLVVVTRDASVINPIRSQLYKIIRASYVHPPAHGSYIVTTTLTDPVLLDEWKENIGVMHRRIVFLRQSLKEKLEKLGTPGPWDYISEQKGMFIYLGLDTPILEKLVDEHHIYFCTDGGGRLNVCGLNSRNIDYVAECIHKVVTDT